MSLDLLQGTLDMLILKALSWGPNHGFGVARWIEARTGDALVVEEGSLYPALHRMTRKGWLLAQWGITANKRRARYYELTPAGREHLAAESRNWSRFTRVVGLVMAGEPGRSS